MRLDEPDAPVCPFLGMATDRHSHFTYPHPGHRCFVGKHPAAADVRRQGTYCLDPGFTACDRHPSQPQAVREGGTSAAAASPGTVVLVLRAGDSLARIANAYGLTVEQIAMANGLAVNDPVADGTRLVIPLSDPYRAYPGGRIGPVDGLERPGR